MLRRATILASVDEPGEAEAAEAWLDAASDRLTYVSDQQGCGCCIVSWDIEGPAELIGTLPPTLLCQSDWDPMPAPPGWRSRLRRLFRR